MRDSYWKCVWGWGWGGITVVFLSRRLYCTFLVTWQIHWQSKWNINIPQPLLVAKETPVGIKTRRDLNSQSQRVCVYVSALQTKCGSAFVCVCLPKRMVLKSRNNITVLQCVHETRLPSRQESRQHEATFGIISSLLHRFNYKSEPFHWRERFSH